MIVVAVGELDGVWQEVLNELQVCNDLWESFQARDDVHNDGLEVVHIYRQLLARYIMIDPKLVDCFGDVICAALVNVFQFAHW